MDAPVRKTIPSGIEPIDSLMGGLDSGELYLVHGEASGKSLFGMAFLIEGLKRGEQAALVCRSVPEDAVKRFARLGYDCLDDVYSGRLVILQSSGAASERDARLDQLTQALRELEWLLGETRPRRLVFDPVTSYIESAQPGLEDRAAEFATWTKSLGATVLLIANGVDSEVTGLFKPHVLESFRFELREAANRATRFIAFEKSLSLRAQAIKVDPSRGIFLSERDQDPPVSPTTFSNAASDSRLVDIDAPPRQQSSQTPVGSEPETNAPRARRDYTVGRINETAPLELDLESIDDAVARLVDHQDQNGSAHSPVTAPAQLAAESRSAEHNAPEELDLTLDLLNELSGAFFPGDLSVGLVSPTPNSDLPIANGGSEQTPSRSLRLVPEGRRDSDKVSRHPGSPREANGEGMIAGRPRTERRARASDLKIDTAMAASAVDTLLGRQRTAKPPSDPAPPSAQPNAAPAQSSVDSKSFKVLVINDEAQPCEIIVQSLKDFTIEQTSDGARGLAGLISYEPDLVVLDLDLPIAEGFKVLAHIRASLTVPVIIVSSTLAQTGDRTRSADVDPESDAEVDQLSKALAASGYYHLTRAFSTKELRDKARQLIARYRGIDAWMRRPSPPVSESASSTGSSNKAVQDERQYSGTQDQHASAAVRGDWLTPYDDFVTELEKRVKAVIDNGSALSVVGCRVLQPPAAQGQIAQFRLREVIRNIVRDTDLASANAPGEVVILLADARASGARAFASRLRQTVEQKMSQEPSVWMRSFPELEETLGASTVYAKPTNGGVHRRRASDRQARG